MALRKVTLLLWLTIAEGILTIFFFLYRLSELQNASLLGDSLTRLGLAGVVFLFVLLLVYVLLRAGRDPAWFEKAVGRASRFLEMKSSISGLRLFDVQTGLVIAQVVAFEAYLLTFFFNTLFLARPLIVYGGVIIFQLWLFLRFSYDHQYRRRPLFVAWLRSGWMAWTPVQRRVFLVLCAIGLVYFFAFIPTNLKGMHPDEEVIYPDIQRMFEPGKTFKDTLQPLIINENWWYGQPYLPISAAAVALPRLLFGESFSADRSLNLLFLRQFVSVLPNILSILLLVYIVTRFKSWAASIGMYVFMLFLPGVFLYNLRFWHPDSLIVLLTALTIFFLQRDDLRFGRDFYLAAVMCGLNIAIKLWGFFFFLTIAVYLLTGLARKVLTLKKTVIFGLCFILIMALTVVLTSPSLLMPWSFNTMVSGMQYQMGVNTEGYDEPDPEGVYQTGLTNWLRFFDIYFMRPYLFFFVFFALALGSFLGGQTGLNRLFFTWCLVVAVYLVNFIAVKSFQYMMPLMIPLNAAVFLLPALAEGQPTGGRLAWLSRPVTRKVLAAILVIVCTLAFVSNLVIILSHPLIGLNLF